MTLLGEEDRPVRALIAGRFDEGALEGSYLRALRRLGLSIFSWDMPKALNSRTRLGKAGAWLNVFLPVERWVMKANRDFLLAVFKEKPDILLVFGTSHVLAGALAQIKAVLPQCKLVLVWPDSLLYCYTWVLDALPVYDLVATYSRATVEPFLNLGATRAAWVPLGFDPELHSPETMEEEKLKARSFGDCDASFIGNHTPEREELICRLTADGFRIRVWGSKGWERAARDKAALKKYWQGGPLFGKDFSLAVKGAPLSLNPINPVTYPAANMRLFEIPGCGGVAVSARSPEMEDSLPDAEACYYYDNEEHASAVIRKALEDADGRKRIAERGREIVLQSHTYTHRAAQILELVGFGSEISGRKISHNFQC